MHRQTKHEGQKFRFNALFGSPGPFIWRRAEKNHDSWVKFKFNLVGNCTAIALLQNFLEKLLLTSFTEQALISL